MTRLKTWIETLFQQSQRRGLRKPRDTDADWEQIGRLDPYYGVLTEARFKTEHLTETTRAEFFETGRYSIRQELAQLRTRFPDFAPQSALDFGCGVGRLTQALATTTGDAVGIDISESMLAEARRTAPRGAAFLHDLPDRKFDWIVSIIVFQHIPPERGYALLSALVDRLAPGGCVTLQFAIFRDFRHRHFAGGRLSIDEARAVASIAPSASELAKGEMMMFDYDLSAIVAILFAAGLDVMDITHTDHGGFHGVILRGRAPGEPVAASDPKAGDAV